MTTHNHNIVGAQLAARIFGRNLQSRSVAALLRGIGIALLAALFLAAPGAALADDECGLQIDSGNPESFDCPDPSYGSGVTYATDGDLTLNFINADSPARSTIGGNGISLTGQGSDSITVDSATTATELQNLGGMSGALLGVTTVDGNIVIDVDQMDADTFSASGVTHAISAESTGAGNIDIETTGIVDVNGSNPSTSIGIEAVTAAGDIAITTNSTVNGEDYGIRAVAGGSGNLTITALGAVSGNGTAPIDATTGTGLLTINIDGSGNIGGDIRVNAGDDAVINIARDLSFGTGLDLTVAGETTLNNDGAIRGALDFSGLSGGYTFNNNAGAIWGVGFNSISDLGTGTLSGTGALNNAGTIEVPRASVISAPGATFTGTGDGVLAMTAVILDGDFQSDCSVVADTELSSTKAVAGCLDLSGGATAGQTAVLIDISGGNPDPFREPLDTPISPGVLLVDVSGGTSAAEHFVLDPGSDNYAPDSVYGGVIQTGGLFDYALLYNPNTQQHGLASVPNAQGLEYAALIHESLSVWHTTSDAVAGRQADLRDGGQRGGWIRAFTGQTERDFTPTVTTHGNTFTYDRGYELDTRGVVAGYDMTANDSHVLGVHLGFMSTRLEHDDSPTTDETTFPSSVTFGAYGGWWNETGLTLDGTLNVNLLDIEHDVRDGLEDTKTNVITAGIRAEAGWRFPMSETFYVQPLATAAYAYADVEKLDMRDYDAKFEDEQSMRAALGVRLGGGTDLTGNRFSRVKYWLTARAWEEFAEDGNLQFLTDGDPLVIEDDISEGFEEVGLGVSLTSPDENLEVFLSGNVRSGDQTDGNNVTIGARLNW